MSDGLASQTPNLAHYSTYPESALIPTANLMLNYVLKPVRHQSFFRKYAGKRYMKVCASYIYFRLVLIRANQHHFNDY